MLNPLPLSPGACLFKYWAPPKNLDFLAKRRLLPIHGDEYNEAAAAMPLAAINIANRWRLVAVCGVTENQNLFIHQGQWLGRFHPACLDTLPFDSLALGHQSVVAFDRSSNLETDSNGVPFFTESGSLHSSVLPYFERLKARYSAYKRVENALMLFDKLNLLVPWPEYHRESIYLDAIGLYTVDAARIAQLSDIDFLAMRNANALAVAAALNISQQQLEGLVRLLRHNSSKEIGFPVS